MLYNWTAPATAQPSNKSLTSTFDRKSWLASTGLERNPSETELTDHYGVARERFARQSTRLQGEGLVENATATAGAYSSLNDKSFDSQRETALPA